MRSIFSVWTADNGISFYVISHHFSKPSIPLGAGVTSEKKTDVVPVLSMLLSIGRYRQRDSY